MPMLEVKIKRYLGAAIYILYKVKIQLKEFYKSGNS